MQVPHRQDALGPLPAGSAEDRRKPAYGLGRLVIAAFGVFAVWSVMVAGYQLIWGSAGPRGPLLVSAGAALGYVLATIALAHNGRRMRMIGWATVGFEMFGVLSVGLMGLGVPEISGLPTVWGDFGYYFWYLPVFLPIAGLIWLFWSNPRRIVQVAGRPQ